MNFYNLDSLAKKLEKLSFFHRVAFAASCCERLLPNYNLFAKQENLGNPSVIRNALDEVWQVVKGKPIDVSRINRLHELCLAEFSLQEDEIFKFGRDYEAQLAILAISYALESCLEITNTQLVIKIVKCIQDTIYEFLIILNDENGDPNWLNKPFEEQRKELSNHYFTLRELAKQKEDLQRLKEVEHLDSELIEWLRNSFDNDGKSVIDLG